MQFDNILCVCTGNICRSPLAEAYLSQALKSSRVTSAGTHALVGRGADEKALAIAKASGLEIGDHRARQLSEEIAHAQDLILVMEKGQLDWVRASFPIVRGKVFLLSQWRDRENVDDPYRHSRQVFDSIYERIKLCSNDWVERLRPVASHSQ